MLALVSFQQNDSFSLIKKPVSSFAKFVSLLIYNVYVCAFASLISQISMVDMLFSGEVDVNQYSLDLITE